MILIQEERVIWCLRVRTSGCWEVRDPGWVLLPAHSVGDCGYVTALLQAPDSSSDKYEEVSGVLFICSLMHFLGKPHDVGFLISVSQVGKRRLRDLTSSSR